MVDSRALLLPAHILVAYDFAAHSSLRTWLAVSQLGEAPAPETENDAQKAKRRRVWRGIIGAIALVLFMTSEFWIIVSQSDKAINAFFGILSGSLLVSGSALRGLSMCLTRLAAP